MSTMRNDLCITSVVYFMRYMLLYLSDLGMVNVIFVVRGVPNNVNYKSNLGERK